MNLLGFLSNECGSTRVNSGNFWEVGPAWMVVLIKEPVGLSDYRLEI